MAKSASKRSAQDTPHKKQDRPVFAADETAFDPTLSSLFATSLGPVAPPPKSRYAQAAQGPSEDNEDDSNEESDAGDNSTSESEVVDGDSDSDDQDASADDDLVPALRNSGNEADLERIQDSVVNGNQDRPQKRKRANKEDDVENTYMQKIAREEAKDEAKRMKKQKTKDEDTRPSLETASDAEESDQESFTIPKHETQMDPIGQGAEELEKAARTVFLGNVSSEAITSKSAEKQLKQHLSSFIPDLADNKPPHKVESIRFRSTAFASALPKRAAFVKKEIMDSTTKSTNAYAVYSTKITAREAVRKLNGSIVLGRHLRVDSVAHPAKVDHRRCIFVGNLGFVDDESSAAGEEGKKKSTKPPSDVEEGLWVNFAKAGKVESVRVVRDSKTRVGKGIAYVQFEDENAVEAALQFNEQKFPPLLPRKLRVTRARAQKRKDKKPTGPPPRSPVSTSKGAYNAKISEEQRSKQGRARVQLGKAAAFKSAESFVFEGHRASSKQGTSGLKLGGKKKKGPNGRKSRSQAWKSSGGKR